MRILKVLVLTLAAWVANPTGIAVQNPVWRTLTFETTEVSSPDVAISPDGRFLIFTMVGKLFRLPVTGGPAEQMTFGPFYDTDPVFSPDGEQVAFQSDRDGGEGNIFVLRLSDRSITQITREPFAERPVWTPAGDALVYLSLDGGYNSLDPIRGATAVIRRIGAAGGAPETLRQAAHATSVFFHPDGRLGWVIAERNSSFLPTHTRIEVGNADGSVSLLRLLDGAASPAIVGVRAGGLYARFEPSGEVPQPSTIVFIPFADGAVQHIVPVSGEMSGVAVAADGGALFVGNLGHLWKVSLRGSDRTDVPFKANVTLVVREATTPPRWHPLEAGDSAAPRTVQDPVLSPDGSRLVFRAVGYLWEQSLRGGPARRLTSDNRSQSDAAFSPDGRQIAFVLDRNIMLHEFSSGSSLIVAPATACGYEQLSWRAARELLVVAGCDHRIVAIDLETRTERLLATATDWEPYPQLSADGSVLIFQAEYPRSAPSLYRLPLTAGATPEALMPIHVDGAKVAVRGQWVVRPIQPQGVEVMTLPSAGEPVRARLLSEADGQDFSITPDGTALLYAAGAVLWREPLAGGPRQEIPIRLTLTAPTPPPVVLDRVRVLDFTAGKFGEETSLLIDGGRIQWLGSAAGRQLPPGAVRVDAGGRFAIPGLFDMHGHGAGCGGATGISYGVTSMRNMGGNLVRQNVYADNADFREEPRARCFYAGPILDARPTNSPSYAVVTTDSEMRASIRIWAAQGARFIKLYDWLPWPLQRAAGDEARRLGLPLHAHGLTIEQAVKRVTLGFAGLAHWGFRGSNFYDDARQMFALAGTLWDPTLGAAGGYELSYRTEPERFRNASRRTPDRSDDAMRGMFAELLRTVHAGYRLGITLMPGTDRGPAGIALQWELEYYAEAGIPPIDILRSATLSAAQSLGAENHLGSLEVGKLADLLLLDSDPLQNIKNTQAIWRVFKGGWQFDPQALRQPQR